MNDPSRHILDRAVDAERNGKRQLQPLPPPPLELALHDCQISVGTITNPDENGGASKAIIAIHATGGIRFIIPLSTDAAREIGNALCDRPNIEVPRIGAQGA